MKLNKTKVAFLIIASVMLFLIGYFINKLNISNGSVKTNEAKVVDSSQANCPYYMNSDFPKEYLTNIFNEVMITYPPSLITSNNETIPLKEKFDSSKSPFGDKLYVIAPNDPWIERKFDVDNDQKDERILSADTAMNHTPNLAVIVKNGYIIFKAEGANIVIKESGDNNGFFLDETVDWNSGEYKTTKYIFRDGKFIPVWFQTSCAVRPQSD